MLPACAWLLLSSLTWTVVCTVSSKRGLVYVKSADHPSDDSIWTRPGSDLTWYYNYDYRPTQSLASSDLEYVPMMWGASDSDATSTTFYDGVKNLISGGTKINYVLGFNEPDGSSSTGGSAVSADLAAEVWIKQIEPLKELDIKLGAPAVTGGASGWTWLQNFFTQCNGRCTVDFIPIHWYGNFDGLASHIGQVISTYPNVSSVWVTEFALAHEDLNSTQQFYNQSTEMLDRWSNVTRYSYFGSFRSDVSNVGPNAAMLTEKGQLTDIGSWYLGGVVTNNIPHGSAGHSVKSSFGWTVIVAIATLLLC